jgi:hypothetical protein
MGDGDENEQMVKEYGLIETIDEIYGSSMERTALQPVQVEIPLNDLIKEFQYKGKTETDILLYLEELHDCEEKEIYLDEPNYKPYPQIVYITFSDDLMVSVTL